jgi:hypothetical protein
MLDLVGQAAQCIVTELSRFVAHGLGAATKPISDAAQHGGNGRSGAFGNFCRGRGCTAANTLYLLLERPQASFDFTDIGEHRTGISRLTKHGAPPWKREQKITA